MVTSYQIKDNTVASVDVKDGTLRTIDLSRSARAALRGNDGETGPPGPGTVIPLDFSANTEDSLSQVLATIDNLTITGRCEYVSSSINGDYQVRTELHIKVSTPSPYTAAVGVLNESYERQSGGADLSAYPFETSKLTAGEERTLVSAWAGTLTGTVSSIGTVQASILPEAGSGVTPITISATATALGRSAPDYNCRIAGNAFRAP